MKKIKKLFQKTGIKQGSYSVGLTALVFAIVVAVNLIMGQLPEKYRNIDVSDTKIYEITDTSKKLLKNLKSEVKLNVLAVKDETDDRITTFLDKYAGLSKRISVEWIDPVVHPSALTDYNTEQNTIVVECEKTGKTSTVAFGDIIVQDMSAYYYTGSAGESEFDGEGQLTAAVNYVTSENSENIYKTTGHGEEELSATVSDLMSKSSYALSELNLLMDANIPEDCDLLLMNQPAKDITEDEKNVISQYLTKGGKVMVLLGDTESTELANLSALLKEYGMEPVEGYIADTQRAYQGNAYYIFPMLSVTGDLAQGIRSQMILVTNAHGLSLGDAARDTISVSEFMSTSDSGYAVTEENQTQGSYTLGAVATENISSEESAENSTDATDNAVSESEKKSRLTVISAGSLIDAEITDTFSTLENTTLFMNAIAANFDGVQNISIEPKSLAVEYNTVQHAGLFSMTVIFGVPLALVIGGFIVWYKRRKA